MKSVVIAGATGYLGRHLVSEYRQRGWHVRALVRNAERARQSSLDAHQLVEAQATVPTDLAGLFGGVDLVVSSLGITRQRDGLSYQDVDYQANANILQAAIAESVPQFAYVHVIGADKMPEVPMVKAKQAFVDQLTSSPIASTVVAPSGYFSDMGDFLSMARSGRVWLFGDGQLKLNPIHGADLASALADAVEEGRDYTELGGPDVFTHTELAELAFASLAKTPKISYLPDGLRRAAARFLPYVTPRPVAGPLQFFLAAMGMDMVGEAVGERHLAAYFSEQARAQSRPGAS